jgi:hypothetical protein
MSNRRSIPILPDSTGRKFLLRHYYEIDYKNAGGNTFSIGDEILGDTSGIEGSINRIIVDDTNNGTLILNLEKSSQDSDVNFTDSEDIKVNGSTIAQANGVGNSLYVQPTQIVSADNSDYAQNVDVQGSAYVRFTEGPAQLDAFGRLQVSTPTSLGQYVHLYGIREELYQDSVSGSASIFHEPESSGVVLENGTLDGDLAQRTTHTYHAYQAGLSQLINMTIACGDTGKTNLIRRWGYYDDEDGAFFELSGSTINVVLRSSTSGSVSETRIPQSNWSIDTLDGSKTLENTSLKTLNIENTNIYWIDFQWLGSGRVRYGLSFDGQRIACHSINNAGTLPRTYMRTGVLPLRYEQINSGSVASTSQMRFFCGVVFSEGKLDLFTRTSFISSLPNEAAPGNLYNKIVPPRLPGRPAISIRAKQTFGTKTNRTLGVPKTLSLVVSSGSAVAVSIRRDATLTGSVNWESLGDSSPFEADYTGEIDEANLGDPVGHWVLVAPGSENVDLSAIFGIDKENVKLSALGYPNTYSYTFLTHNISNIFSTDPFSASFFYSTTGSITRPSGDFTADGFESGMSIHVSGSENNVGYYFLDSVNALTMSLREADVLVPEGPINEVTVEGGLPSLAHYAINVEEFI